MQSNSFEVELPVPTLASKEGGSETCRAVFIRAPAIVDVGPSVQVLAEYSLAPGQSVDASDQVKILRSPLLAQAANYPELCVVKLYALSMQKNQSVSSSFSGLLRSSDSGAPFMCALQKGGSKGKVVVAVKQNNMLATAFHPELTSDLRWQDSALLIFET